VKGLDILEGLPQDWGGFKSANALSWWRKTPPCNGQVELHSGWFDDSLPQWLAENPVLLRHHAIAIFTLDSNVFQSLGDRIVSGPRHHVRRALQYRTGRSTNARQFRKLVAERG